MLLQLLEPVGTGKELINEGFAFRSSFQANLSSLKEMTVVEKVYDGYLLIFRNLT